MNPWSTLMKCNNCIISIKTKDFIIFHTLTCKMYDKVDNGCLNTDGRENRPKTIFNEKE